jgi:hypothetical protein
MLKKNFSSFIFLKWLFIVGWLQFDEQARVLGFWKMFALEPNYLIPFFIQGSVKMTLLSLDELNIITDFFWFLSAFGFLVLIYVVWT